jgi:hypothetical protein
MNGWTNGDVLSQRDQPAAIAIESVEAGFGIL